MAGLSLDKNTGENTEKDAVGAQPSDGELSLEKDAEETVNEHSVQVAQVGQSRLKLNVGSEFGKRTRWEC